MNDDSNNLWELLQLNDMKNSASCRSLSPCSVFDRYVTLGDTASRVCKEDTRSLTLLDIPLLPNLDVESLPRTCKTCVYIPHRTELQSAYCVTCGFVKPTVKSILWYNQKRRVYKSAMGLSSIITPLSWSSSQQLAEFCLSHKIMSNKTMIHVTLVEGLSVVQTDEEYAARRDMFNTLQRVILAHNEDSDGDDLLCIKKITSIPTHRSKKNDALIMLQVDFVSPTIRKYLATVAKSSAVKLPQYQLHCALGTTSVSNARTCCSDRNLLEMLQETVQLRVNAFDLQERGPPAVPEKPAVAKLHSVIRSKHHV